MANGYSGYNTSNWGAGDPFAPGGPGLLPNPSPPSVPVNSGPGPQTAPALPPAPFTPIRVPRSIADPGEPGGWGGAPTSPITGLPLPISTPGGFNPSPPGIGAQPSGSSGFDPVTGLPYSFLDPSQQAAPTDPLNGAPISSLNPIQKRELLSYLTRQTPGQTTENPYLGALARLSMGGQPMAPSAGENSLLSLIGSLMPAKVGAQRYLD